MSVQKIGVRREVHFRRLRTEGGPAHPSLLPPLPRLRWQRKAQLLPFSPTSRLPPRLLKNLVEQNTEMCSVFKAFRLAFSGQQTRTQEKKGGETFTSRGRGGGLRSQLVRRCLQIRASDSLKPTGWVGWTAYIQLLNLRNWRQPISGEMKISSQL